MCADGGGAHCALRTAHCALRTADPRDPYSPASACSPAHTTAAGASSALISGKDMLKMSAPRAHHCAADATAGDENAAGAVGEGSASVPAPSSARPLLTPLLAPPLAPPPLLSTTLSLAPPVTSSTTACSAACTRGW